ncbi:MAG: T9SS type A sorting domain-containing protein, partial [Cytophagaceae bacterium]
VLNNDTLYVGGGVGGPFDFDDSGPLLSMVFEENAGIATFLVKYSIAPALSITKNQFNTAITAWPNPANELITIENITEPFSLFDVYGRSVANYPSTQTEINVSALSTGTYILKSGENSIKILKK